MKKWIIEGGRSLRGTVTIDGMKNAALPILFATLLCQEPCILHNLPDVGDIRDTLEILSVMGAYVTHEEDGSVRIDTRDVKQGTSPNELVKRMRGSTYLIGAELGRFGKAKVGVTGGCNFGSRPIDLHINGFRTLGATVSDSDGYVIAHTDGRGLNGTTIFLDTPSVGATANLMLAASTARGDTIIKCAAREPHIVDLAVFLNACGARVFGAGTSTIRIKGVEKLHGTEYTIVPDMIEAGTYMIAAAVTGGDVLLRHVVPHHVSMLTDKMREMGITVEEKADTIHVVSRGSFHGISFQTQVYPGFPTDMQPQMTVLLALAHGVSKMQENVFKKRFRYVDELKRMGAAIDIDEENCSATILGVSSLHGADVTALDLRAGAALVIAALAANGETQISEVTHIERGYVDFISKLTMLGAYIRVMEF